MNVHNKPNVYTINNIAPPSYTEATGVPTSRTYNPEIDNNYPHVSVYPSSPSAPLPYPHPSNYYLNNTPAQSVYPEFGPTEQQSTGVLIIGTREENTCGTAFRIVWIICVLAVIAGVLTTIFKAAGY
ncbi:PREDICTED: uncharacterized protein LOC105564535 [Vollenhovia emeryi]|uniref:uncharacterized protein LOC105564535 n=1 Tax=Vollenhovia emeryi TaxID=411798 RepID=UPI0005F47872|nr:PREDICTED: uncharacterized protein LOC105564535 [Vollenhovia emeryi]XP_011872360.1 PREDICTED: uncharacterized protein LOC105564535 [Vollenhovia emeryi]XP_011872361.1 PREDICTED: uncharacterized protein LOC105564535 [Vollenhovia emeryi]XP_011872362.1 PREDICTED: uncharacterized protein LOC105564535 [Vollenhovia emeryi]XP_011872363.1 PREDICTED: uncharacterized protein LOC105564535 [Vollenhovia emeryi]